MSQLSARREETIARFRRLTLYPVVETAWVGQMVGNSGSCSSFFSELRFSLMSRDGVLYGEGFSQDFPYQESDKGFVLDGHQCDDGLIFALHFKAGAFIHVPFLCNTSLGIHNDRLVGSFSLACHDPRRCGCTGGSGTFAFNLVHQTGHSR